MPSIPRVSQNCFPKPSRCFFRAFKWSVPSVRHTLSVILCLLPYPEIRCGVPFKCRPNCHNRNGKRCFYCACLQDTALRSPRSAASPQLTHKAFNCFVLVGFFFIFPFLSTSYVMVGSFFVASQTTCSVLFFKVFLLCALVTMRISIYAFQQITLEQQRRNQKSKYQGNQQKGQVFALLCATF